MPLATFSREMLLGVIEREGREKDEIVTRMIGLEESVAELRHLIQEASRTVNQLCMASVASSALLKDDPKESREVASRAILDHIEEAMRVAPGLLKRHSK